MSDQRNMILAIVLSAIVLFGWGFIAERWFPTANEPSTKVVEGKQVLVLEGFPRRDLPFDDLAEDAVGILLAHGQSGIGRLALRFMPPRTMR